jgi:hypothetical protein
VSAEIQINALARFREDAAVGEAGVVSMLSITLDDLSVEGAIDPRDYLDRIDVLAEGEFTVLISNYVEYFRLAEYVARYTSEPIGIALGVANLTTIFDERHYEDLDGGVLEALGRLFKQQVKLLVYPMLHPESGELITAHNHKLPSALDGMYRYLLDPPTSGRNYAREIRRGKTWCRPASPTQSNPRSCSATTRRVDGPRTVFRRSGTKIVRSSPSKGFVTRSRLMAGHRGKVREISR